LTKILGDAFSALTCIGERVADPVERSLESGLEQQN